MYTTGGCTGDGDGDGDGGATGGGGGGGSGSASSPKDGYAEPWTRYSCKRALRRSFALLVPSAFAC